MPAGLSSSSGDDLSRAEREIQERIGDLQIDLDSLAAISNVFRVANVARHHLERTALREYGLSFTAFTVLWVVWVWGEHEARHLAAEAGISKSTLSGVLTTLEKRGLVQRRHHPSDKRLVLVTATSEGKATMIELFPKFNAEESRISSSLNTEEKRAMAQALRQVLRTLEEI